ncbi:hypothetical protein [Streptomyces sp. NPDC056144]|uniref:hypothetical protein n=1 Tax=unclassified Streptomyces TaxID=2593676 RepID=UPI0035D901E8
MPRRADETARAVEYLCKREAVFRSILVRDGGAAALDAALTAIRTGAGGGSGPGADVREALDGLNLALRRAGHAKGLYGELRGADVPPPASSFPGLDTTQPPDTGAGPLTPIYACPGARCRRLEAVRGPAPVPVCAVTGGPMELPVPGDGS